MSARRLLILCYFYPPLAGGGVHRVLGFTRHLPEHGWDCTVVCAGPEDYWVVDESLVASVTPGTEVVRVTGGSGLSTWLKWTRGRRGQRSGRAAARLRALSEWWWLPDSYVGWSRRAGEAAARLLAAPAGARSSRFDAVLSSSPPDSVHLAALGLKRRSGLPWVADFRDPWVALSYLPPPTPWHRRRQAQLEREVLESADVTLAASRTHADLLERRAAAGRGPKRVVHLPNGYEPEQPEPPRVGDAGMGEGSAAVEDAARDAGRFTLVFTGMLHRMPDTEVLLEALHDLLGRHPDLRQRLRAELVGPFDSGYEDRARALGLGGVAEFLGPRPHAEARALQRAADALLLWKPRHCSAMVPGKLYEYLDAGRPVIALLEPGEEAAELVRAAGGAVLAPGDREGLAAEIERRYRAWRPGGATRGTRPAWLEEHTRARLAARLARVLHELVENRA